MSISTLFRLSVIVAAFSCHSLFAQDYSQLWGKEGEAWTPSSRLPDFSHAGYHRGEKEIPLVPVVSNVKDFGAVGDGEHDDTQALKKAIESTERGAIFLPEGRYKIMEIIEIAKPNLVLRGAGSNKTVLYFPIPLQTLRPNNGATTSGRPTSNYSWSGGHIWLKGSFQSKALTRISGTAKRGDTQIKVESAEGIQPGQSIEIRQQDTKENTLAAHLYSDDPGDTSLILGRTRASLVTQVRSVQGNVIEIDRPLRFDIRPEWKPEVLAYNPTVTESGIEDLGFDYPVSPYEGHFTELGMNPIALSQVADCWARNIWIHNADSGFFVSGRFCTIQNVVYESERPVDEQGCTGHHGVDISGDDNLFTEFDFRTRFIHDLTVSHCAGNVFSNGKGVDLCFDHHKRAPYANLFTTIDIGAGTRMWKCGGGDKLGRHSAGHTTFWNIKAAAPQSYPKNFGPASMNLVAIQTNQSSETKPDGKWFEAIDPKKLSPANLHEVQRRKRLSR